VCDLTFGDHQDDKHDQPTIQSTVEALAEKARMLVVRLGSLAHVIALC
jgi:hypothetical protein